MKIEKINDNQIRCTLTRADLAERHLHLGELAYGTEKVKSLFRDMMQQAAYEVGFEANDIPLMIEAIPKSADSIVLIITKVEDPEELDTRFSKFAPSSNNDWNALKNAFPGKLDGADTILDFLGKVKERLQNSTALDETTGDAQLQAQTSAASSNHCDNSEEPPETLKLFSFADMNGVLKAARLLRPMYFGSNTLYKDAEEDVYILALAQSDHTARDFNRICNMLSEYGSLEPSSGTTLAYLKEHCETLIATNAVQQLAVI